MALITCRNTCEDPYYIHYLLLRHTYITRLHDFLAGNVQRRLPPFWREAHAIPFFKPNKSGSLAQDYRPTALIRYLCRLLKRMVNFRLIWYLRVPFLVWISTRKEYCCSISLSRDLYINNFRSPRICPYYISFILKSI